MKNNTVKTYIDKDTGVVRSFSWKENTKIVRSNSKKINEIPLPNPQEIIHGTLYEYHNNLRIPNRKNEINFKCRFCKRTLIFNCEKEEITRVTNHDTEKHPVLKMN